MKKTKASPDDDRVTLKIRFTAPEHKQLRMAAAELEITIAEFMHTAVVQAAQGAVKSYIDRELGHETIRASSPSVE
jgi:uncharacterized protein (DUF1778 family)